MKNTMQYKNYIGSVKYSEADRVYYGKVLGVRALISFEGKNMEELLDDFHRAVDEYIDICQSNGLTPETPCLEK